MRLIQYLADDGAPAVGRIQAVGPLLQQVRPVSEYRTTYELALAALGRAVSWELLARATTGAGVDYDVLLKENRLLSPLTHPDPAHCRVTGTGLTHLGSADTRDVMHRKLQQTESEMSDSM